MKEKILIALGDTNLIKILTNSLNKFGYTVDYISDGNNVINKIKSFKPDLILFDIVIPGKNGYEIMIEKSFDKDITKIPVIIVSNNGAPIQMNKIPSTPTIKDYIIRFHIEPNEVIEKIEKVFGRVYLGKKIDQNINKINKKILWVEDDKLLSNILSKKIQQSGFDLLKATNVDEAFKILESEIPNIIILDILLPEMSGLDILQKIKTFEKFRKIPVIMLSNLSKQSDIEKAKILGANKFIIKATASLDEITDEIKSLTNII